LVDAKWDSLRAQGFTGAMSDMTLQWLQANGATSDQISDAWLEMLTEQLTTNAPNLCVNPTLTGGAASGPNDGSNPPTGYSIGFNTVDSGPVTGGWEMNPNKDLGRSYLGYAIFTNHPTVQVGEIYEIRCRIRAGDLSGGGTRTMSISGNGVTQISHDSNISANSEKECSIRFQINADGTNAQVRMGVGVTTNQTDHLTMLSPVEFIDPALEVLPSSSQRNSMWYELLGRLGYEGQLNDREFAFWSDGGVPPALGSDGPAQLESFLGSEGWAVTRTGEQFSVVQGVHEWRFTWEEADAGVYADDLPSPLRSDIDDYFGR
jgi:hypothetical protein